LCCFNQDDDAQNEDPISSFSFNLPEESDWYRAEPHADWDMLEQGLLYTIQGEQMQRTGNDMMELFDRGLWFTMQGEQIQRMGNDITQEASGSLRAAGVDQDEINEYIHTKEQDLYHKLSAN